MPWRYESYEKLSAAEHRKIIEAYRKGFRDFDNDIIVNSAATVLKANRINDFDHLTVGPSHAGEAWELWVQLIGKINTDKHYIFFSLPTVIANQPHSVTVVIDTRKKECNIVDSLGSTYAQAIKQLKDVIDNGLLAGYEIVCPPEETPNQQNDQISCGIHTAANIVGIITGDIDVRSGSGIAPRSKAEVDRLLGTFRTAYLDVAPSREKALEEPRLYQRQKKLVRDVLVELQQKTFSQDIKTDIAQLHKEFADLTHPDRRREKESSFPQVIQQLRTLYPTSSILNHLSSDAFYAKLPQNIEVNAASIFPSLVAFLEGEIRRAMTPPSAAVASSAPAPQNEVERKIKAAVEHRAKAKEDDLEFISSPLPKNDNSEFLIPTRDVCEMPFPKFGFFQTTNTFPEKLLERDDLALGPHEFRKKQEDCLAWYRMAQSQLNKLSPRQIAHRLWTAYQICDKNIRELGFPGGTTASTTIYDGRGHLITATLADAVTFAAIYDRNGKPLGVKRLNKVTHKPDNEDETNRIHQAGGQVFNGRVGRLNISRAIGDTNHKPIVCAEAHIDITSTYQVLVDCGVDPKEVGSMKIITTSDGFTEGSHGQSKEDQEAYLLKALKVISSKEKRPPEHELAKELANYSRKVITDYFKDPDKYNSQEEYTKLRKRAAKGNISRDNITVGIQTLTFDELPFLFGVFDGHGGAKVAAYTAANIGDIVKAQLALTDEEYKAQEFSIWNKQQEYLRDNSLLEKVLYEEERKAWTEYQANRGAAAKKTDTQQQAQDKMPKEAVVTPKVAAPQDKAHKEDETQRLFEQERAAKEAEGRAREAEVRKKEEEAQRLYQQERTAKEAEGRAREAEIRKKEEEAQKRLEQEKAAKEAQDKVLKEAEARKKEEEAEKRLEQEKAAKEAQDKALKEAEARKKEEEAEKRLEQEKAAKEAQDKTLKEAEAQNKEEQESIVQPNLGYNIVDVHPKAKPNELLQDFVQFLINKLSGKELSGRWTHDTLGSGGKIDMLVDIKEWLNRATLTDEQSKEIILAMVRDVCGIKRYSLTWWTPHSLDEFEDLLSEKKYKSLKMDEHISFTTKTLKDEFKAKGEGKDAKDWVEGLVNKAKEASLSLKSTPSQGK